MYTKNLLHNFKTGDILLNDTIGISSTILKTFLNNNIKHSCIIIRLDISQLPNLKIVYTGGTPFLFEISHCKNKIQYYLTNDKYINHSVYKLELNPELYTTEFEKELQNIISQFCNYIIINNKTINLHSNKPNIILYKSNNITVIYPICSELTFGIYNRLLNIQSTKYIYYPYDFYYSDNLGSYFKKSIVYTDNLQTYYNLYTIVIIVFLILICLYIYNTQIFIFILLFIIFLCIGFLIFYTLCWKK